MSDPLPQTPQDAVTPPPPAKEPQSRKWIWPAGILMVLAVLAVVLAPLVVRKRNGNDQIEAVNDLRQIGLALFEFETAYGRYPDDTTIAKVREANPASTIPLGKTSANEYFRQLLVAEVVQSESMFYAKSPDTHKPDNVMDGKWALGNGECAFAYIPGQSSKSPPGTPIVLFPLVRGKLIFDYKLCKKRYYGKAMVIRADNSITSMPVDKSGHVKIGGKDLFDPSQSFWNGKVPEVKWPK